MRLQTIGSGERERGTFMNIIKHQSFMCEYIIHGFRAADVNKTKRKSENCHSVTRHIVRKM